MGKGRTLAGFVVENIARGRKRHVWISVSSDLYEGEQDCVVGYSSMNILVLQVTMHFSTHHHYLRVNPDGSFF